MPLTHPVRDLWAKKKCAANAWISTGSAFVAEIFAMQGYDTVSVDMQHGMGDFGETLAMFQAIRAGGGTPMVRVPTLEPSIISRVLDAGALGVICPLIDTAEEARQLVSYVRYAPLGVRSSGPTRANLIYPDYTGTFANTQPIVLAMIETQTGMDNLESIVRTPGLDGVYIGPSDLSIGLSKGKLPAGFDRQEPEMVAAIQKIIATAHTAGIKACLHCGSSEYAAKAVGWGVDLVTLLNDVRMMAAAAAASVKRFHELSAESPS
jgi:4-hydroxy-2-oxoheptanedioate aldolase